MLQKIKKLYFTGFFFFFSLFVLFLILNSALTEKIVSVLPKMKCPHRLEPHQIQGLDFIHIFPVVQVITLFWIIIFNQNKKLKA